MRDNSVECTVRGTLEQQALRPQSSVTTFSPWLSTVLFYCILLLIIAACKALACECKCKRNPPGEINHLVLPMPKLCMLMGIMSMALKWSHCLPRSKPCFSSMSILSLVVAGCWRQLPWIQGQRRLVASIQGTTNKITSTRDSTHEICQWWVWRWGLGLEQQTWDWTQGGSNLNFPIAATNVSVLPPWRQQWATSNDFHHGMVNALPILECLWFGCWCKVVDELGNSALLARMKGSSPLNFYGCFLWRTWVIWR